jgi:hypothetical protein
MMSKGKLLRGGFQVNDSKTCRSGCRTFLEEFATNRIGFRIVITKQRTKL